MKTFSLSFLSVIFLLIAQSGFAQTKTEKFPVSGECGMCKNKIEGAAKSAGATYALWDEVSKELTVKYNSTSSNTAKIQQSIAGSGYDTPEYKATDAAYEKLHACCKYERTANSTSCCDGTTCTKEACKTCCKDGKCTTGADCCKDGKCSKESLSGHNTKAGAGAACCKKS